MHTFDLSIYLKYLKDIFEIRYFLKNEQEKIILKLLDGQGVHIDFLIKNSGLNSQIVNSTLAFMELKGWIKNLGNMTYVLNN